MASRGKVKTKSGVLTLPKLLFTIELKYHVNDMRIQISSPLILLSTVQLLCLMARIRWHEFLDPNVVLRFDLLLRLITKMKNRYQTKPSLLLRASHLTTVHRMVDSYLQSTVSDSHLRKSISAEWKASLKAKAKPTEFFCQRKV